MKKQPNKLRFLPVILAAVTAAACAILMLANGVTHDAIAEQKQQATLRSLTLLMPDDLHDNDVLTDAFEIYAPQDLGHRKAMTVYVGYQGGQLSVVALPVIAPNGYSGDIELMVGISATGEITAVEVLAHKETPGLGDLVERRKGDWLLQFDNKSLAQPNAQGWKVKKDGGEFDQITGATITPRAIVQAVNKALKYFELHSNRWQDQNWRIREHGEDKLNRDPRVKPEDDRGGIQ